MQSKENGYPRAHGIVSGHVSWKSKSYIILYVAKRNAMTSRFVCHDRVTIGVYFRILTRVVIVAHDTISDKYDDDNDGHDAKNDMDDVDDELSLPDHPSTSK